MTAQFNIFDDKENSDSNEPWNLLESYVELARGAMTASELDHD